MSDLETLLAPLVKVLAESRRRRLVARPGWVAVDRADGSGQVEVSWSEEDHAEARAQLEGPVDLPLGYTAVDVGGTLVLQAPPDPNRRIEDVAQEGWISTMAGRTLSAALATGRNVLVAGPWPVAVEIIAALTADGTRPAVAGRPGDATPPSWPLVRDADEVVAYGADRVAAWSLDAATIVGLMGRCSGVVAWLDARRLERALMRYEAGVERLGVSGHTPLHVLAGLDIVVVATDIGGPRVQQVAEIDLVEEGYRPRLLFASGQPPVATALVPVGLPSFVADLDHLGQSVLADELRSAVGVALQPVRQPEPRTQPAADEVASEPVIETPSRPQPRARRVEVPPEPVVDPTLQAAPPPGWELDQLGDEESIAEDTGEGSAEDAVMAATYGLGPPPRPPGVNPDAGRSFEDALAAARERDEELRAELGDDYPGGANYGDGPGEGPDDGSGEGTADGLD